MDKAKTQKTNTMSTKKQKTKQKTKKLGKTPSAREE